MIRGCLHSSHLSTKPQFHPISDYRALGVCLRTPNTPPSGTACTPTPASRVSGAGRRRTCASPLRNTCYTPSGRDPRRCSDCRAPGLAGMSGTGGCMTMAGCTYAMSVFNVHAGLAMLRTVEAQALLQSHGLPLPSGHGLRHLDPSVARPFRPARRGIASY